MGCKPSKEEIKKKTQTMDESKHSTVKKDYIRLEKPENQRKPSAPPPEYEDYPPPPALDD